MSNKQFNPKDGNPKYGKPGERRGGRGGRRKPPKEDLPNNPSWYAKSEQLLKDVASLTFPNVLGLPLKFEEPIDPTGGRTIPGILTLEYAHSTGCGTADTDAATVAARYLYTFVRHANSGSANYDSTDLYMMILAWHSANAYLQQAKRAYGALLNYSATNRYFVKTVVEAMGFDFDDVKRNMTQFRTLINEYSAKLNSVKVPNEMPIGLRWNQLASDYYVDGKTSKSQIYIPVCTQFWKYSGFSSETGTELISFPFGSLNTVADFDASANNLIAPLFQDEDVATMSGDIRKAFGDAVTTSAMIDENYTSIPLESDEMLTQIHNAICFGPIGERSITQSNGVIIEKVTTAQMNELKASAVRSFSEGRNWYILNMMKDDTTPSENMVATRLIPGNVEETESGIMTYRSTGSEIPLRFVIYSEPSTDDGDRQTVFAFDSIAVYSNYDGAYLLDVFESRVNALLSAFNWHPRRYLFAPNAGEDAAVFSTQFGELDNYTTIPVDRISSMHKIAVLSELSTSTHTSI